MPTGFRGLTGLKPWYSASDDLLKDFYIPVLSTARRLDRSVGYFTSQSLALAARGLARLIANQGKMRLLVGTDLQEEDVAAIEKGTNLGEITQDRLLGVFQGPRGQIERRRLEALAWMIAAGTLEIRVVLPRGRAGYFHVKHGIATDPHGDRIAWSGSNNETMAGWMENYEEFSVSPSWQDDWAATQALSISRSFERLWEDRDPKWRTLPIPDAARSHLIRYTPSKAPKIDPEEEHAQVDWQAELDHDQVIAAWLRDVPHLLGMEGRIGGTAAIQPWPHQRRVADQVVARFPERFLLADEVGLGKTIEVGLILRDLLVSKTVERCLILVPASVRIQWQGELFEKFGIAVPVYDGHQLINAGPRHRVRSLRSPSRWTEEPLVLASSQLAKRTDRREEIWEGPEWDMVVVDEAHHARRKGYDEDRRRPNRLLELLEGVGDRPGLAAKTRGLLLLTATPMQVHPVEVWDLLTQLGLPGRWGAHEQYFLRYFEELRKAPTEWAEVDWRLVADMARDEREHGGPVDRKIEERIKTGIGWAGWERLLQNLSQPAGIRRIRNSEERQALLKVFQHLTPLRRRMHRNTRQLLHGYQQQGLLPGRLADRLPEPRWVEMEADEKTLYRRVEEYISEFYNRYEEQRKGLGFVMTVYRRRLTSSFHALEKSLQRRLEFLRGHHNDPGITEEDLEEDELAMDIGETLEEDPGGLRSLFAEEIEYVEEFLQRLRDLGTDTKYAQLVDDLSVALARRSNVVIFTQYTDTMDSLRERLRGTYGRRIACYSGRGGQRWTGSGWERVGKEEIKQAFRKGEVQILVGTDAMAEGLNLQTCGVEINYDVPWNPMRLEQRIGRVDRIGQRFDTVWIWSYFLEETIEAEVYRRLQDRIDWFQCVVGSLQPILHLVGKTIRKLALEPGSTRSVEMDRELTRITGQITQAEQEGMDFGRHLAQPPLDGDRPPPATPAELESFFTTSHTLGHRFQSCPDLPEAYRLDRKHLVTFSAELANERPDTLQLLTFGNRLFEELLDDAQAPAGTSFGLLRLKGRQERRTRVEWYRNRNGLPEPIMSLGELQSALADGTEQRHCPEDQAREAFTATLRQEAARRQQTEKRVQDERRSALVERGRRLLTRAAYVWSARGRVLFDDGPPALGDYTLQAMIDAEGYPWAPLRRLAGSQLRLTPDSREWQEISPKSRSQLDGQWATLKTQVEQLLPLLATTPQPDEPHPPPTPQVEVEITPI